MQSAAAVQLKSVDSISELKALFKSSKTLFHVNDIVIICICKELDSESLNDIEFI